MATTLGLKTPKMAAGKDERLSGRRCSTLQAYKTSSHRPAVRIVLAYMVEQGQNLIQVFWNLST